MAILAPQPQEPTPTEMWQWQSGRENARTQYLNQQAATTYQTGLAKQALSTGLQQQALQQGQQRQTFDDPYIARGIFNSGIRRQGLGNWQAQQYMNKEALGNQYANTMGGIDLADTQAYNLKDTYMRNSAAQELARRQELASQIKGIL